MTERAALDSQTVRGPDFESGRWMRLPLIQSHSRERTSPRRHPVSISRRMTATICGHQNASRVRPQSLFDPTVLDGLATAGIEPPKSNWALRLDEPPFAAWSATGGITFTFGGLAIDEQARVLGTDWRPMPGLYTCGEMVGGLFHFNYPGGTGLVSGAVFGRIAGRSAARDRAGS